MEKQYPTIYLIWNSEIIKEVSTKTSRHRDIVRGWEGLYPPKKWKECRLVYDNGKVYNLPKQTVKQKTLYKKKLKANKRSGVACLSLVGK